jgi:putative hydrolase of the HAD superfamily
MNVLMLDVDGVLVHEPPAETFTRDAELDAAMAVIRAQLSADDRKSIATGHSDLLERIDEVIRALQLPVTADRMLDYWYPSETHIDAAVLEAGKRVRAGGMRVFLATNQEHRRARYLMEALGLLSHVDGMVYSAALGHRKPSPDYFALAAATVRARPADIVFIDDNAANVEAARVAGWRATQWLGDMSLDEAISAAR